MAEISRVVPPEGDFDYIGFSFNGVFSKNNDFTIYRVVDGDRYTIELSS
jgi:hypothetical protein